MCRGRLSLLRRLKLWLLRPATWPSSSSFPASLHKYPRRVSAQRPAQHGALIHHTRSASTPLVCSGCRRHRPSILSVFRRNLRGAWASKGHGLTCVWPCESFAFFYEVSQSPVSVSPPNTMLRTPSPLLATRDFYLLLSGVLEAALAQAKVAMATAVRASGGQPAAQDRWITPISCGRPVLSPSSLPPSRARFSVLSGR